MTRPITGAVCSSACDTVAPRSVAVSRLQRQLAPPVDDFATVLLQGATQCPCGALSADALLAHAKLEPRQDHPDPTRRASSDGAVKDDGSAEHIVRSSILELLREDEAGSAGSPPPRAVETIVESALNDIWALRSKEHGSPMRFKA